MIENRLKPLYPDIVIAKSSTSIGRHIYLSAHDLDIAELLAAHPDLARDDVQACLAYAQAIVTGEEVSPKPPKGRRADAAQLDLVRAETRRRPSLPSAG